MSVFTQKALPLFLAGFLSVQIVGCTAAEELIRIENISQTNLLTQIRTEQPPLIIDVRSPSEYAAGHIPGAINIEFRELKNRLSEIEQFQYSTIVVYCETGIRAKVAEVTLTQAGFQSILHLEGHMSAWRSNSLPVTKSNS